NSSDSEFSFLFLNLAIIFSLLKTEYHHQNSALVPVQIPLDHNKLDCNPHSLLVAVVGGCYLAGDDS
ncbi:hypothetical protein, partial [Lonepinella koalarum]|uniref:hypothetical protein n=1 Tax=Lonepinella koalarum TaxID=53417 RepID=UPI003F6E2F82